MRFKHDPLTDERTLAGLLLNPALCEHLDPSHFSTDSYRAIFNGIKALGNAVDLITLANWLKENCHGPTPTDGDLARLYDQPAIYAENARGYASALVKRHYGHQIANLQHGAPPDTDAIRRLLNEQDTRLAALAGDTGALDTFSAYDLQGMTFPEPKWAVQDLLPEGLCILAGKPKLGKSFLAIGLGTAIATGGLVLGKIPVQQGRALYLALEDTQRRLQDRMHKMFPYGGTWPAQLEFKTDWPRGAVGLDLLDTWLGKHPDTRLAIVDTLGRLRAPQKGRNVYAEDYDDLVALKSIADRHAVCLICVTHLRKAGADDLFDQVTGSTGITGAADATLILTRARGDKAAILTATGRDFDDVEWALSWKDCLWKLEGDAAEVKLSEERRALVDLLKDKPAGMKAKAIAEALDKSFGSVRAMLKRAANAGQLEQIDGGAYILPRPVCLILPDNDDAKQGNASNTGNVSNVSNVSNTGSNRVTVLLQGDLQSNAADASNHAGFDGNVTHVTAFEHESADNQAISMVTVPTLPERILSILASNPPAEWGADDLADELDTTPEAIRPALNSLEASGAVTRPHPSRSIYLAAAGGLRP